VSESLDRARSIFASWERGDFRSVEWADPEVEFVMVDGPTPGTWHGLPGMEEGWRDFLHIWDDWRVTAEGMREAGEERVLVLGRFSGRGKASGVELSDLSTHGACTIQTSGGKVTRVAIYWDRERALADLGLAE
jgi:hypothetical protein